MKGIVITTTNEIYLDDFTSPLYESVKKTIDGWIEIVHPRGLEYPFCMIVNDEGLLRGLPYNAAGSWLYETRKHGSPILGNIIIMKDGMTPAGPDIVGLTDEEAKTLYAKYKELFKLKEKKK